MSKPPHSVTLIGCIFIAAGAVGLAYHASEFRAGQPIQYNLLLVCFVRILAIVFGVFALRGNNWARWGLLVWMAYHVILSGFHSLTQLAVHGALLVAIAYFLWGARVGVFSRCGGRALRLLMGPPVNRQLAAISRITSKYASRGTAHRRTR